MLLVGQGHHRKESSGHFEVVEPLTSIRIACEGCVKLISQVLRACFVGVFSHPGTLTIVASIIIEGWLLFIVFNWPIIFIVAGVFWPWFLLPIPLIMCSIGSTRPFAETLVSVMVPTTRLIILAEDQVERFNDGLFL